MYIKEKRKYYLLLLDIDILKRTVHNTFRTGEVQVHKSEWLTPLAGGLVKTCLLAFYYAFYYAILFFTTLFTTLREAPANDLYVFWHVPNRQYGRADQMVVQNLYSGEFLSLPAGHGVQVF